MTPPPAKSERLLQINVAIVSLLGIVMLAMGQRDLKLAFVAILALAASLFLTDIKGWVRLNRTLGNLAAIAAVAISVGDFLRFDSDTQLLAIANLLIYLQIVLLFQEKYLRLYWQILTLSLLEVVVGAALNLGVSFGFLLALYMYFMIAALLLLFVRRETARQPQGAEFSSAEGGRGVVGRWLRYFADPVPVGAGNRNNSDTEDHAPAASSPAHGRPAEIVILPCPATQAETQLLGGGLWRPAGRLGLGTLAVAALLFFSVPRFGQTMWQSGTVAMTNTVGFSSTVSLGALGAVAENPELVMRVEFRRAGTNEPYQVIGDPLFRGSLLTNYRRGQWEQMNRAPLFTRNLGQVPFAPQYDELIQQRITIEPLDEPVLFGVYPLYNERGTAEDRNIRYDSLLRQLVRTPDEKVGRITYETVTTGLGLGQQTPVFFERPVVSSWERWQLLKYPGKRPEPGEEPDTEDDSRDKIPTVIATAEEQITRAGVERDDPQFQYKAARALEAYLRSPQFKYSLQPLPRDPELDPIEDFIKNRPQGHCEYFASALALMLRTQGIPSRVVVGFKGGEFNRSGNFYQVRQLHAHAWVEALLSVDQIPPAQLPRGYVVRPGQRRGGRPQAWLILDPTPLPQEPEVASGWYNAVADFGDYLQHLWSTYVVGLNATRQQQSIYAPLSALANTASWLADEEGAPSALGAAWGGLTEMSRSIHGITLLALAAAIVAVALRYGWRLVRRASAPRWFSFRPRLKRHQRVEFYERLERLLARHGFRRAARQTQLEFARAVAAALVDSAAGAAHAGLPRRITEAYYRVRFGRHTLDRREVDSIEQQLATLEQALAASRSAGAPGSRTLKKARA